MINKMKNLLIIAVVSITLAACATFQGATPSQKVSAVEAGFTSVVETFNAARKPCVTGTGLCLIDDKLYREINPVLQATQKALTTARSFINAGQIDQAKAWLEEATLNVATLTTFITAIKEAKKAAERLIGVQ